MKENQQTRGNTRGNVNMQTIIIPIAIIVAGGLIALGIYMSSRSTNTAQAPAVQKPDTVVLPVTEADHVLGNPKTAKVTIIEYSDLECPFCRMYHATLEQIWNDHKADGTVAWVYRHAPIVQLHSKSPKESEATECAAELGGNEVFWKYLTALFRDTPSNNGLNPQKLYDFANTVGLDAKAFKTCLDSGKYATKINEQINAAQKAGVLGTPFTYLVVGGKNIPLVDDKGESLGALPYENMKQVVEQVGK